MFRLKNKKLGFDYVFEKLNTEKTEVYKYAYLGIELYKLVWPEAKPDEDQYEILNEEPIKKVFLNGKSFEYLGDFYNTDIWLDTTFNVILLKDFDNGKKNYYQVDESDIKEIKDLINDMDNAETGSVVDDCAQQLEQLF